MISSCNLSIACQPLITNTTTTIPPPMRVNQWLCYCLILSGCLKLQPTHTAITPNQWLRPSIAPKPLVFAASRLHNFTRTPLSSVCLVLDLQLPKDLCLVYYFWVAVRSECVLQFVQEKCSSGVLFSCASSPGPAWSIVLDWEDVPNFPRCPGSIWVVWVVGEI